MPGLRPGGFASLVPGCASQPVPLAVATIPAPLPGEAFAFPRGGNSRSVRFLEQYF